MCNKSKLKQKLLFVASAYGIFVEAVSLHIGIAEQELSYDRLLELPLFEVCKPYSLPLLALKKRLGKELLGVVVYNQKRLLMVSARNLFCTLYALPNLYSILLPQVFKSLYIAHLLVVHKECYGVALLVAAKAVVILAGR